MYPLSTLQVYCVATGRYACHNKYYGRSLDDSGFKSAIVEYLTGGGGDLRDCLSDDHLIGLCYLNHGTKISFIMIDLITRTMYSPAFYPFTSNDPKQIF